MSDQRTADEYKRFRVQMHSAPGMWARYDGHVDVLVADIDSAFAEAVKKLARTSFPDRASLSSWRLDGVSQL